MALGMVGTLARRPAMDTRWRRRARPRWWGRQISIALVRYHSARATNGADGTHTRPQSLSITAECEGFIRLHEREILNYVWRMTGDEQAAYDLTQEVFLRAWQRFEVIQRYEQPRSWLFRVATNLALSHVRRRTVLLRGTRELMGEHEPASSDPAWRLAERDLVRQTLLQLSPKRRAALVLREVYGLTAAEVGGIVGMSETAVRMALHRAREQFRELYLQEGGAGDGH
jgi:RNA polymerase sigma-70 factor (ECF subfamily)